MIEQLTSLKFYIFQTDQSCPFITSDNPGFSITPEEKIVNTGFSNWSAFSFPLNPTNLFLIYKGSKEEWGTIFKRIHLCKADRTFVEQANKAAIVNCNHSVFANKKLILDTLNQTFRIPFQSTS